MSEEHTVEAVLCRRSLQLGRRCEARYRQSMGEDAWRRVLKTRAHLWLSNVHEHGMEGGCTAGCTAPVQFYAFFCGELGRQELFVPHGHIRALLCRSC